jgi:putative hydrolase of the HAD superfamily
MSATRAVSAIGFDADDTLWRHAEFYLRAEDRLTALLAHCSKSEDLIGKLREVERRNLPLYGFGAKGFTLSMIETAIGVADEGAPVELIQEIIAAGRELILHPIEPLPHARETLAQLSQAYRLILITRGDLLDQERKLALSGLEPFFDAIEIVSDKSATTYERIFSRCADGPDRAMMVGNSLRSDVIPALEAGCWGVHVPQEGAWIVEHAEPPTDAQRFRNIAHLGELPGVLRTL